MSGSPKLTSAFTLDAEDVIGLYKNYIGTYQLFMGKNKSINPAFASMFFSFIQCESWSYMVLKMTDSVIEQDNSCGSSSWPEFNKCDLILDVAYLVAYHVVKVFKFLWTGWIVGYSRQIM
jgi:hypothetical protein